MTVSEPRVVFIIPRPGYTSKIKIIKCRKGNFYHKLLNNTCISVYSHRSGLRSGGLKVSVGFTGSCVSTLHRSCVFLDFSKGFMSEKVPKRWGCKSQRRYVTSDIRLFHVFPQKEDLNVTIIAAVASYDRHGCMEVFPPSADLCVKE